MFAKKIAVFIVFLSCLFYFSLSFAKFNASNFELVESVPKATIFYKSHIRTTKNVWLNMINHAQKTIDIGAFYFSSCPRSSIMPIVQAIKKAAHRGVKVCILLDKSFYHQSVTTVKLFKHIQNISIQFVPMNILTGGVMHAKYMIVDGENSFVGSQNFDWKALDQIHEIGVRIKNKKLAQTLLNIFNLDWVLCGKKNISQAYSLLNKVKLSSPITHNNPILIPIHDETLVIYPAFSPKKLLPKNVDWELNRLVDLLNQAKHRILIQVLLYSAGPSYHHKGYWSELDNAIRSAAGRGVKVYMIVSNWSLRKPEINFVKSLSVIPNVHIKVSALPPYHHKFMSYARVEHCKYMAIDHDILWIGTGNWEKDYFYKSRNIAIIIHGKNPNKILSNIFFRDWNGPYVLRINPCKKYSSPKRY